MALKICRLKHWEKHRKWQCNPIGPTRVLPADFFLQMDPDFTPYAINQPDPARRHKAREWFLQTLDYALASPELASRAHQAVIWHINADWPRNMSLPQPWLRMSDHDPVVLDFVFSHAVTSD